MFPGLTPGAVKCFYFSFFGELSIFALGHAGSSLLLGLFSSCGELTLQLQCRGRSSRWIACCRAQALGLLGFSGCGSRALEHKSNSCGARIQLLQGRWGLPRLGIKPVSPALAGRFLTTEPPEKPLIFSDNSVYILETTFQILIRFAICKYFLLLCELHFHFLDGIL